MRPNLDIVPVNYKVSIRSSDTMMEVFVVYFDAIALIVQGAQKLVDILKEDKEMVVWGNTALGDAKTL
jgi:hypothetical protein